MEILNQEDPKNSNNTGIPIFYSFLTKADLYDLLAEAMKEAMDKSKNNIISSTLNPDELLTREEAAQEFKVSIATIDNYRRDGVLIPCRLKGTIRFRRGDLQAAFSNSIISPHKLTRGKQ